MQVMEQFKKLCAIAHCSGETDEMARFLRERAEACGYAVEQDGAGNILCTSASAKVTLQAHYDMVCIGSAPQLQLYEEAGWLGAEDSTLGADNGIAMAMMLQLMEEGAEADMLFTNDEEIGLLGARALKVSLKTPYLLNLDSEEEGIVTIGCAGGVDIIATLPLRRERIEAPCYELLVEGLPGGHSGVDIDKGIPNAICELAKQLDRQMALIALEGGERRNAIAKRARALYTMESDCGGRPLGRIACSRVTNASSLIAALKGFNHGVRSRDDELGIVYSSINLATVRMDETHCTVGLSARSMEAEALKALQEETETYFRSYGFEVRSEGFYTPWPPKQSGFAQKVREQYAAIAGESTFGAIHAGLECGIICERYPGLEAASIGPNIVAPHSTAERVELASVERVYATVKAILSAL